MSQDKIIFPDNFIWGTATASYQIEGAAHTDGRGPSIWDTFSHTPGKVLNGDTGDVACDHYNRLNEDLDLLKAIVPNYRFSVSWSRVLPEGRGQINEKGIAFYDRLIDGLLARGIAPWTTMFHWDLPQALQDKGGFSNRDILGWFDDYAELLVRRFGDRVNNWITFNEPSVYAWIGHSIGVHAPGLRDEKAYLPCAHHINMVIGRTYRALKSEKSTLNVGSSYTLMTIRGEKPDTDRKTVGTMDALWNGNHFDPLMKGYYPAVMAEQFEPYIKGNDMQVARNKMDFVGVQHYTPFEAKRDTSYPFNVIWGDKPAHTQKTDIGWSIEPDGFYECLTNFKKLYGNVPLLVTENGCAWFDEVAGDGACHDPKRIDYLHNYISAMHRAMKDGVNMIGYFVWSFLDNFEWAEGYSQRFGITHVDYKNNCKRTPKDSYYWYGDVVRANSLVAERDKKDAA